MNEPRVISIRSKWLILSAILIFVLASLALVFWAGVFSPAEEKIERIYFASCEWSLDSSSGNVTAATLHIVNTGADDLVINKVSINGTLLSSAEWECFLSSRLKPADQGYLRITPSSLIFSRGTTYMFTLETTARNIFSYSSIAGAGGQTQQAGVMLVKENVSWPSSNSITIVIRNTGTSKGNITAIYVGTSANNLTSATVNSPSLPATVNAGASQSFTITFTWSANTRYYFKFSTDTPAILEFNEKSP